MNVDNCDSAPPSGPSNVDFKLLSLAELLSICESRMICKGEWKRSKKKIIDAFPTLPLLVRQDILQAINDKKSRHWTRSTSDDDAWGSLPKPSMSTSEALHGPYFTPPSIDVQKLSIRNFIQATSNDEVKSSICASCAQECLKKETTGIHLDDIPNHCRLQPHKIHPGHILTRGMLLYDEAEIENDVVQICKDCLRDLQANRTPRLSLANGMWIGRIPFSLRILTMTEQVLIAKYLPNAHIIKLFPKSINRNALDADSLNSALKGNVSTYPLNSQAISSMIDGSIFPQPTSILPSVIGVTFVGPGNFPVQSLPKGLLLVRRQAVANALAWLKNNNPLYANIIISLDRLRSLPENDIPEELLSAVRVSNDVQSLENEKDSYVPDDENEPIQNDIPSEVGIYPIQSLGILDVNGAEIPNHELMAHALSNTASEENGNSFYVRRGSAFINEYARVDPISKQRYDGGPSNANHLLGSFPTLFPYGLGGFEVGRPLNVPYELHARWALRYGDKRFRLNHQFVFQIFGVMQKRAICRSARLYVQKNFYLQNETSIRKLKSSDFVQASHEETRKEKISNPVIRELQRHVTAIRIKVQGTDEARRTIRNKIWGTILMFNGPSLWITINPSDIHDPIAQVLTGCDIDLDNFVQNAGPNNKQRAINIAKDPYAAAKFFNFIIAAILECLFGIKQTTKDGVIQRRSGILGTVNAYVGTVEAQGRGTLHLHLLVWLAGAPPDSVIQKCLTEESFRQKVCSFIASNIHADLPVSDYLESTTISESTSDLSYSRPLHPDSEQYEEECNILESKLARNLQYHRCNEKTCRWNKGTSEKCKRGAPFKKAIDNWVDSDGENGPRRLSGWLNSWNPHILLCGRCNHDIKCLIGGTWTKALVWYITAYATKKRKSSSNTSALLAKRFAFNDLKVAPVNSAEKSKEANSRLLQRCANALSRDQEFSAPEVISLIMGWKDHFISHNYVPIYLDSALRAIKRVFTQFNNKRTEVTGENNAEGRPSNAEDTTPSDQVNITLEDGEFRSKDQLRDYHFRGLELEHLSLLQFLLQTRDEALDIKRNVKRKKTDVGNGSSISTESKIDDLSENDSEDRDLEDDDGDDDNVNSTVDPNTSSSVGTGNKRKRGRKAHTRIPYLAAANRPNRCRILRSKGHETLPEFIGGWFPRHDVDETKELYYAAILMLMKPWRSLLDLKTERETFHNAFNRYEKNADNFSRQIIENSQYYWQCMSSAKKQREGGVVETTSLGGFNKDDLFQDEEMSVDSYNKEFRRTRSRPMYNDREAEFGAQAIEIAYRASIFDKDVQLEPSLKPVKKATAELTAVFDKCNTELRATEREKLYGDYDENSNVGKAENRNGDVNLNRVQGRKVDDAASVSLRVPQKSPFAVPAIREANLEKILNPDQRRTFNTIAQHLEAKKKGRRPNQLLMLIQGHGGTGKSLLIKAITELFELNQYWRHLAKTATTGVAASLIGGQTIHSWLGLSINTSRNDDWLERCSKKNKEKRIKNFMLTEYLIIDECSMLTCEHLFYLSRIAATIRASLGLGNVNEAFGGLNVILLGDFHQFPPVMRTNAALYCIRGGGTERGTTGRALFEQFKSVFFLRKQMRTVDKEWAALLGRLRIGECTEADLDEINKLVLSNPACQIPDFSQPPWSDCVLVTSRHGVRRAWNTESVKRHCKKTGNTLFISHAIDLVKESMQEVDEETYDKIQSMSSKQTGKLEESVELAIGIRAMVVINIATEADIANGTRGIIEDIILDEREKQEDLVAKEDGAVHLKYPPCAILFRPDTKVLRSFAGLPEGIIPIIPSKVSFSVELSDGRQRNIIRSQLAVTPGYGFTDFRAQGQTIQYVIVDLADPPSGKLTPFNAYVALSRSTGRETIRLLRPYNESLFTRHPSEDLRIEMERLFRLEKRGDDGEEDNKRI